MEQQRKPFAPIIILQIYGILIFIGILLAGSDSPWMPWNNLLGLALVVFGGMGMRRLK